MAGRIQFTNGNGTEYIYTANGEQRTIHRTAVANMGYPIGVGVPLPPYLTLSVDSTDYIGNFIFHNGKVDKFLFNGGYCSFTSDNQPVYHYYTQDHLGNNRAVVNENGTLEQVNHYYPFGDVYADAGLNFATQPYKYNSKELDRMYRLDWYDYGARDYDAVVPMWTSVDPLCEKYYNISPYMYAENDPVRFIDPDGNGTWDEVCFAAQHPSIARQIGAFSKGSLNISTDAVRFTKALNLNETSEREGSQVNAFRHTLWQATIANKFGSDIAKQVGDAHEDNPSVNLINKTFKGTNALSQADQTTDLLNNQIGRSIAGKNPNLSMQQLATKVLDEFHKNGLYTVTSVKNGSFVVTKTKITDEQYKNGMNILKGLNVNGYTTEQQRKRDEEDRKERNRSSKNNGGFQNLIF